MANTKNDSLASLTLTSTSSAISRTELIDIITEDTLADINAELAVLKKQVRDIEDNTFTFEQVKHILKKGTYTVSRSYSSGKVELIIVIRDRGELTTGNDATFKRYAQELKSLKKKWSDLVDQRHKIENNKRFFKTEILKKVLADSQEGRDILTQLSTLKVQLRRQLSK